MKRMTAQQLSAWLSVALWMAVIFVFSAVPTLESPFEGNVDFVLRKIAHALEYAILTWLVFRALALQGMSKGSAVRAAVLLALLYAASDEYHQTFVSGRVGVVRDVGIDAMGILASARWIRKHPNKNSGS